MKEEIKKEKEKEEEKQREKERRKRRREEEEKVAVVATVSLCVCVCVCCDWFWGCQESLGRKVVIRVILICLELCCFRIRGKGREGRVQVHIF